MVLAIKYHGFNQQPVNNEGKVLWDADKLEGLNLDRWQRLVTAVRQRDIGNWQFDYSRQLHDKRIN